MRSIAASFNLTNAIYLTIERLRGRYTGAECIARFALFPQKLYDSIALEETLNVL